MLPGPGTGYRNNGITIGLSPARPEPSPGSAHYYARPCKWFSLPDVAPLWHAEYVDDHLDASR